jgi:hypothetical protein
MITPKIPDGRPDDDDVADDQWRSLVSVVLAREERWKSLGEIDLPLSPKFQRVGRCGINGD